MYCIVFFCSLVHSDVLSRFGRHTTGMKNDKTKHVKVNKNEKVNEKREEKHATNKSADVLIYDNYRILCHGICAKPLQVLQVNDSQV